MKKIILLLLSVFLAHGAMADDSTGELTQPIIKTAHGDFNAYGRPVAYLRANLQTLDFQSIQDAANHGDAHAQFVMAKFYEMGVHVSKDPTQAQKWYEKSAQLGNSDAQNNLAVYYFEANNPTKAREYLNYAVNQNHLMAMVNMAQDLLRKDGKGDQQAGIELLSGRWQVIIKWGCCRLFHQNKECNMPKKLSYGQAVPVIAGMSLVAILKIIMTGMPKNKHNTKKLKPFVIQAIKLTSVLSLLAKKPKPSWSGSVNGKARHKF